MSRMNLDERECTRMLYAYRSTSGVGLSILESSELDKELDEELDEPTDVVEVSVTGASSSPSAFRSEVMETSWPLNSILPSKTSGRWGYRVAPSPSVMKMHLTRKLHSS